MSLLTQIAALLKGQCEVPLAIVLLNTPCDNLLPLMKQIWKPCIQHGCVACADGGANRLYDALTVQERTEFVPQLICGDLDSIRPDVLSFYKSKGVDIQLLDDQDHTDLTKTLHHLLLLRSKAHLKFSSILVYNSLVGRGDQVFGCLQSLYEAAQVDPSVPVHLLSDNSVMWLLQPGSHAIPSDTGLEESHCGLIPLGKAVQSVTTSGLKWNLKDDCLSFGGLISTCNLLDTCHSQVAVDTSDTLVWTMSHTLLSHSNKFKCHLAHKQL